MSDRRRIVATVTVLGTIAELAEPGELDALAAELEQYAEMACSGNLQAVSVRVELELGAADPPAEATAC